MQKYFKFLIAKRRSDENLDKKTIFGYPKKRKLHMKFKFIGYILIFALGVFIGSYVTHSILKDKSEDIVITHSLIVNKIESLGKLEVVKYNMQDIIEYKKMRQWLPNAKTALLVSGEVFACVDLTHISEERVAISGDSIALLLPSPEICHVKVDHSKSKIYDMTYGLWESAALMDEAYKHAEKELIAQSKRLDLTKEARDNTQAVLTPMLNAFGFKHVTIIYDDRIGIRK